MFKLYWAPYSGPFIVHAALEETGADYVLHEIKYEKNEHKSPDFLAINPKGQLPAIILEDGSVLTETVAIILHLAERFPEAGLLPETGSVERAMAYRWLMYMATNTYGNDLRYYYSDSYTTDPAGEEGVKQSAGMQMDGDFNYLDQVLGGQTWLAGERPSIADTYLTMMAMWHWDVPVMLERCSNVARVVREVQNRPAINGIWDQNFPDAPPL